MENTVFGYRLKIVFEDTLLTVNKRIKKLRGRDKLALQTEFLDWTSQDWEDVEIFYRDYWDAD